MIGAGVVGLAVARALALAGREVMVLEGEGAIGTGTSSRNSEVIHAGIYYPPGSLKARLCVQGKAMLYDYCAERGIAHRRCGKLIVANTPSQLAALPGIVERARANGVDDLRLLTGEEARALEPALQCLGAVHSPSTGIVDSHALMLALQGDLENAGGLVACRSRGAVARGAAMRASRWSAADGLRLLARTVVNAAGLARLRSGRCHPRAWIRATCPRAWYAKGSYFTLAGRSPFQRLIYPAPEPDKHLAGLGVHLTLDLGGQAKFGPDVQWIDDPTGPASRPGAWRCLLCRGAPLLARLARWRAAARTTQACAQRSAARDEPAADFLHPGPRGARRAGPGQPVRHRVAGLDQRAGHCRAVCAICFSTSRLTVSGSLAAMRRIGFGRRAHQRRPLVDQAGVDLHHVGAGVDLAHRILRAHDAAHADDGEARAQRARSWRITRLLMASTGAPDRPPASSAWGSPATASRLSVVLVAITPSPGWRPAVGAVAQQRGGDHRRPGRRPGRARF